MRVARFFEMARFFISALLVVSSPPEHWSWSCSTRAFFEKKLSAGTESELRRALQQHAHMLTTIATALPQMLSRKM